MIALSTQRASTADATRSLAQQEFNEYLAAQSRSIAPAKIDRVDATASLTYLSVVDEDLPNTNPVRLMVQLEDWQGNEHLVDIVTNNDRVPFITRVINSTFDRTWRIAESWTPEHPF